MKEDILPKIVLIVLPLILLLILFLIPDKKSIVIKNFENFECEEFIRIGDELNGINDKDIKSIENFEEIKKQITPNQTIFILSNNKIVRCKALENYVFEVEEKEYKLFFKPTNLERIVIKNAEKNKKLIEMLGYKNFILDGNKIILPKDYNLLNILSSEKKLYFYIEREFKIEENNTVKILNEEVPIEKLYELYDKVYISENNVTVKIYLFNQSNIKDISIQKSGNYFVNLTIKIDDSAYKNLIKNIENIPLKLIQLEKYYDAKLAIEYKNMKIFESFLPYKNYTHYISIFFEDNKHGENIKNIIVSNLIDKEDISIEENFNIFTPEKILLAILTLLTIYLIFRIKNLEILLYIPLIISSLIFIPFFSLLVFVFFTIHSIKFKKINYELLFLFIFSTIFLTYLFYGKVFISVFTFSLTLISLMLIEVFSREFKKYNFLILSIFVLFSLSLFFFNVLISFSILLSLFLRFFVKYLSYY